MQVLVQRVTWERECASALLRNEVLTNWAHCLHIERPHEAETLLSLGLSGNRWLCRAFVMRRGMPRMLSTPDIEAGAFEEVHVLMTVGRRSGFMLWDNHAERPHEQLVMQLPSDGIIFEDMLDMETASAQWHRNNSHVLQFRHATTSCYVLRLGKHVPCSEWQVCTLWEAALPKLDGGVEILSSRLEESGVLNVPGDVLTYMHGQTNILTAPTPLLNGPDIESSSASFWSMEFLSFLSFRPTGQLTSLEPYVVSPCVHQLLTARVTIGVGASNGEEDELGLASDAKLMLQALFAATPMVASEVGSVTLGPVRATYLY